MLCVKYISLLSITNTSQIRCIIAFHTCTNMKKGENGRHTTFFAGYMPHSHFYMNVTDVTSTMNDRHE